MTEKSKNTIRKSVAKLKRYRKKAASEIWMARVHKEAGEEWDAEKVKSELDAMRLECAEAKKDFHNIAEVLRSFGFLPKQFSSLAEIVKSTLELVLKDRDDVRKECERIYTQRDDARDEHQEDILHIKELERRIEDRNDCILSLARRLVDNDKAAELVRQLRAKNPEETTEESA